MSKIRFSTWSQKVISVNSLRFDPENPRLAESDRGERDIIKKLAELEDLETLLRSMQANGHAPIERLVVVSEENRPIVIEGNRRLAVYKMILNERLVPKKLETLVKKVAHALGGEVPKRIECAVAPDRAQANVYAFMKHAGESFNKKWAPIQQAVFIVREADKAASNGYVLNEFTPAVIKDSRGMIELYELAGVVSQDPASGVGPALLRSFPFEAVRRTFLAEGLSQHVGLKATTNGIEVKGDVEQFKTFYAKVLKEMQGSAATRVFDKAENIKEWIKRDGFKPSGAGKVPLKSYLSTVPSAKPASGSNGVTVPPKSPGRPPKAAPPRAIRPLFDPPFTGPHLTGRLHAIVEELEKMVPVETYTNSIGVMLRVLLELTLAAALKRHHEWGGLVASAGNQKIGPSLREILEHIVAGSSSIRLDPNESEALKQLHKNRTSLLSVGSMNQFVHNADFPPDVTGVRSLASKMRPVLQRCYDA